MKEKWLHYRGRLQYFSAMLVLFGAREVGYFREVAALCSDLSGRFTVFISMTV